MTQIYNLTVIQTNDTHGYLESHPELVWSGSEASYPTLGGYARIASLLNAARRENPGGVLVLDNGDTFHGTYPAVVSRGEALIPLVNALKIDAMMAHWEFAWGPAHFRKLVDRLDYPILAINCYDKATGDRAFPASVVLERAGLRLGVIGIAATIIDKSMPPHFSEGLRFTLGLDELPAEIDRLKRGERVNLVVVLSHLGFPQDVKLTASVKGIDVLLSGHTHNRLERAARIGNTLIIQSGCHGSFIGRLDLKVAGNRIIDAQHQLIPVEDSMVPDYAMQRLVDEVMRPICSNVFSASLRTPDFILTNPVAFDDLLQQRKKRPSCSRQRVNPSVLVQAAASNSNLRWLRVQDLTWLGGEQAASSGTHTHVPILRTNSGSSCLWLRMIPSLGTNASRHFVWLAAIDPRQSACRIHTAGRWSFRLQEPSPRVLALAQKSASVQDNWFSEPQ